MSYRGWMLLAALLLSGAVFPTAAYSQATAPVDSTTSEEGSWLDRNLKRYLGHGNQEAEQLDGQAYEIADRYQKHAGKPIEVVLVHQVPSFREGWDQDKPTSQRLLTSMTRPFQSYTKDSVIRDYILFQQGETVDPFALADTEVLLRGLPYIHDVRIVLIPLLGEIESVAIVVETTDRWPFGINGKLVTRDKYSVELYSENVAGGGVSFHNEFIHEKGKNPDWGYRGRLGKRNINGTFLAGELHYEDSYFKHQTAIRLDRELAHPGLHLVGGVAYRRTDDFEDEGRDKKYDFYDIWAGDVKRVDDAENAGYHSRTILVPALRYFRYDYHDRPTVDPDSNRGFHDRATILAGLALQRFKNYKTNYLFADGETEDVPVGFAAQLTSGFENREFEDRVPVFVEGAWLSLRQSGDLYFLAATTGGYIRAGEPEDGILDLRGNYITPLFGKDHLQYRFYTGLKYTLGLDRHPFDRISLGDEDGIRDLPNNQVWGNQRLLGTLESRVFTRISLWGFRFSFSAFCDGGMVGAEDASSIFKEKIYVSSGLGIRLRNPSLVLPTVQLQLSFLSNVGDSGLAFQVKLGNAPTTELKIPGTKPNIPGYE